MFHKRSLGKFLPRKRTYMLIIKLCLPLAMADVIIHLYDMTGCDHKCGFYGLEKNNNKNKQINKQKKQKQKQS